MRLTRVEDKLGALNDKIDRLSPKIVRQDFERELNKRDARIRSLEDRVQRLISSLDYVQQQLRESGAENARLRGRLGGIRSDLSEMAADLGSLSHDVGSAENQLPEGNRSYILEKLNRLQRKLDELTRRLES